MMSIHILIIHNSFADCDMFMRYQGDGVGHLYMRAIKAWLAKTGWGSNNILIPTNNDINLKGDGNNSEHNGGSGGGDNSEDEVSEGDVGSNYASNSDGGSGTDVDPDIEYVSSENDEETMDGEYGFSSL